MNTKTKYIIGLGAVGVSVIVFMFLQALEADRAAEISKKQTAIALPNVGTSLSEAKQINESKSNVEIVKTVEAELLNEYSDKIKKENEQSEFFNQDQSIKLDLVDNKYESLIKSKTTNSQQPHVVKDNYSEYRPVESNQPVQQAQVKASPKVKTKANNSVKQNNYSTDNGGSDNSNSFNITRSETAVNGTSNSKLLNSVVAEKGSVLIPVSVFGNQNVSSQGKITIRTTDSFTINNVVVPRNTMIEAITTAGSQRLMINISSISVGNNIVIVEGQLFDPKDNLAGIWAPFDVQKEAISEAGNETFDEAISEATQGLYGIDKLAKGISKINKASSQSVFVPDGYKLTLKN